MDSFHFLRPVWLLAFVPLFAALWRLHRSRSRLGNLTRICDPVLLPHLIIDRPLGKRTTLGLWLTALGGSLAIVALAGPVWDRLPVPVFRNENAVVIVLDLSTAMDASDLKPSRLDRARYKIADLLRARRDGQTALVIYAGDAFTVTPLTDDAATIASQLSALSTELSPVSGQRADLGLDLAVRLLRQAGLRSGDILLMTAGADQSAALEAAKRVRDEGFRLSVLGVGTEAGGPVPRSKGGLWKDEQGNILVPKLDPSALRRLADAGDGRYREITADSSDIDALLAFFNRPAPNTVQSSAAQVRLEQWIERGPWLVLAILPIAALAFRRGWLLLVPLIMVVLPERSEAFEWRDLWSRRDRRAESAFQQQHYEEAARQFDDPAWRGAAWYRAGEYEKALQSLHGIDSAEGWYNKGNALAQLGRYREAIEAYSQAMERDPGHTDAKHNKELLEKAMKQQEQKQRQASDSSSNEQGGDQEQESQADEGSDTQQGKQSPGKSDDSGQTKEQEAGSDSEDTPASSDSSGSSDQPQDQQRDAAGRGASSVEDRPAGSEKPQGGRENEQPSGEKVEAAGTAMEQSQRRETEQANEQWLRRIPDDPAGLLKRKFAWQYRQRQQQNKEQEE